MPEQTTEVNADQFVTQFLDANPSLDASSPRVAYHAARQAGFEMLAAVGIEARVLAATKAQRTGERAPCAHVAEYGEHAWANDSDARMHCVECGRKENRQAGTVGAERREEFAREVESGRA